MGNPSKISFHKDTIHKVDSDDEYVASPSLYFSLTRDLESENWDGQVSNAIAIMNLWHIFSN